MTASDENFARRCRAWKFGFTCQCVFNI